MCCFLFCRRLAARVKMLTRQVEFLSQQTGQLTERVESLESQVLTGLTIIPELIHYFEVRTGQQVRVSTTFVTLEGVVLATAEDGVQLREASGDLVLIPFANITSVQ
ncbi:hypothetical protein PVOR_22974 [Paenibacillus vortex V453]|jgi:hypothetical protein|uniref:DUF2642 domain-containing protein n=3 Tax=Paenibacillus TaxID=44249 RepID=A0A163EFM7_9BACL|nr:hypothetical protein A3958_25980 [Paenibacillus glucanolyticus]AWP26861.1 hypothetical protein B9D94_09615 [Paenibacillus sp. Cedars]EFU40166.1 hypothetical protein PVOR_22974 [Paenibacillus vortex V453]ETT34474.1 hypothetical protein C169_18989 [Paenibacillus sp. FSL R5-808]MDH6669558.1 hypothetical protein [Paenibacillus sp. LBL]